MNDPVSDSGSNPPAPQFEFDVGDTLTIYAVEALCDALKPVLKQHQALRVSLSRVTACDSLGIQALCVAKRSAEAAGKSFRIVAASEVVRRSATAIGCESLLLPRKEQP